MRRPCTGTGTTVYYIMSKTLNGYGKDKDSTQSRTKQGKIQQINSFPACGHQIIPNNDWRPGHRDRCGFSGYIFIYI